MYLFILESIGTSELILIGIIALIFLGPRKLPEIARKIGKITSEFRNTTNEFKNTWEREVNFEEEAKAFNFDDDEPKPIERVNSILAPPRDPETETPSIKEIDPSEFEAKTAIATDQLVQTEPAANTDAGVSEEDISDKKNWL